jgi:Fe-S cluster assembly ATP-binding protein
MSLEIRDLHITVGEKQIVSGVSITVKPGEVHVIMGPNGSGKSTLANAVLGHPKYSINKGKIMVDGTDVTALSPDQRARKGLFLSMQNSPEINGVTVAHFLRVTTNILTGVNQNPFVFHEAMKVAMDKLFMDHGFATRYLNAGFSGGEKKRAEILQLLMLNPSYAILDETDSGLDVDALKIVGKGINEFKDRNKGVLLITHYNRLLEYVIPTHIHVMARGQIVDNGGKELALEIEKNGYKKYV